MGEDSSKKITENSIHVATKPKQNLKTDFFFDATKTIEALKIIAKKRDPEIRKQLLADISRKLKKKAKTKLIVPEKREISFHSSLPMFITPEAQKLVEKLGNLKKGVVKFLNNMKDEGSIVYIDNSGKPATKKVVGVFRKLYIEKNTTNMDITKMGIFVETQKSNPELLEFIIRVPSLPSVLRAKRFNDQGGLTHQFRIFRPLKNGER